MTYVLTFVASSKPLAPAHINTVREILTRHNLKLVGAPVWLATGKAADIVVDDKPSRSVLDDLRASLNDDKIDIFSTAAKNRRKKLLLADMESTIVDKEALDELAVFIGIQDKIAAITHAAMEGKLDFKEALRERVGLLKDLPADKLQKVLESMALNPGALELTRTMKKHGALCVLVSGGFTFFTEPVSKCAGFDHHHGNNLEVKNGKLTGQVSAPILDKAAKLEFLRQYAGDLKIDLADAMTIGDGANDSPMRKAAGFGVGYQPKAAVATEIDSLIIYGDLSAALYAQGYSQADFA